MKLSEAVEQLKDIKEHCQDQSRSALSDVWEKDVEALNIVIKKYEEYSLKEMSIEEVVR